MNCLSYNLVSERTTTETNGFVDILTSTDVKSPICLPTNLANGKFGTSNFCFFKTSFCFVMLVLLKGCHHLKCSAVLAVSRIHTSYQLALPRGAPKVTLPVASDGNLSNINSQ